MTCLVSTEAACCAEGLLPVSVCKLSSNFFTCGSWSSSSTFTHGHNFQDPSELQIIQHAEENALLKCNPIMLVTTKATNCMLFICIAYVHCQRTRFSLHSRFTDKYACKSQSVDGFSCLFYGCRLLISCLHLLSDCLTTQLYTVRNALV